MRSAIEFYHRFLTHFGSYFRLFWEPLGSHLGVLGNIWAALSAHWSLFCHLLAHLGAILVPLAYTLSYFVPPELILEPLGTNFGAEMDRKSIICQGPTECAKRLNQRKQKQNEWIDKLKIPN